MLGKIIIGIIILIIIGIIIYVIYRVVHKKNIGEACDSNNDCVGMFDFFSQVGCCKGVCTRKTQDWAKVYYCPDECQDAPSPLGKPGSCASGNSWPRKEGQPCDTQPACDGWIAGKVGTLACCQGTCVKQLSDWAGMGYCPNECLDAPSPLGKPGSCNSGNSWPRKEGQPCDTQPACDGWIAGKVGTLACCQGKCEKQLSDWAGMGYCPNECQDAPSPLGKPGSCNSGNSWPRKENQPCDAHSACEGWVAGQVGSLACCQGKCTRQKKDWAGMGYCPNECQDAPSPLGKPGSCNSGNSWPRKEGQPCDAHSACEGWVAGQVGSLACCQGKCTRQKKDWAGMGYCPNECKGCITCSPGSC